MSLWTFCESVAAATLANVAGFESGRAFGGKFDLTEVNRQSFKLPALFVTCERTERESTGYHTAQMVIVIAAKSSTAADRSPAVMALASKVLAWIHGQDFNDQQAKSGADKVESHNLYGAKADERGVHLWAVTFETQLELTGDGEPAELPDAEIVADWDLHDADGDIEKTDEIDLNP